MKENKGTDCMKENKGTIVSERPIIGKNINFCNKNRVNFYSIF